MKKIFIEILSEKGEKAYKEIKSAPVSWKDKTITNRVFQEQILSENPTKFAINIKISWLAEKIDILSQIRAGFNQYGCSEGNDYSMEVE